MGSVGSSGSGSAAVRAWPASPARRNRRSGAPRGSRPQDELSIGASLAVADWKMVGHQMGTRYRWAVLALGVLAQGSFTAYSQGLASLGPVFRSQLAINLVATGTLLTAVSIGTALTLVAWGMLTERIGERSVLGLGLGGAGLCLGAAGFMTAYLPMLALLVLAGMLGACSIAAGGRAVLGWVGPRARGTALGVGQRAGPLGAGLAAATLPLVALGSGLRGALLLLAAVSLASGLLCALWIRTPPSARGSAAPPGRSPLADPRIWRLALGGSLL